MAATIQRISFNQLNLLLIVDMAWDLLLETYLSTLKGMVKKKDITELTFSKFCTML